MRVFAMVTAWLMTMRERGRGDRADVPGWVMVTVMTAVLVVAILGIFEPQIKDALSGIIDSVSGKK